MIETIEIAGQEHQIEVKPITLICKSGNLYDDVKYKDRFPIDMETSLYHMDRVNKLHGKTVYYLEKAFPEINFKVENVSNFIRQSGTGVKHLAGRLDLTLKLIDSNVPIAWVHPEASLHPAVQLKLADITIELMKGN